jgi:hypothetical protein
MRLFHFRKIYKFRDNSEYTNGKDNNHRDKGMSDNNKIKRFVWWNRCTPCMLSYIHNREQNVISMHVSMVPRKDYMNMYIITSINNSAGQ